MSEKELLEKRLLSIQKIEDLKDSLQNSGKFEKSELSDYLEQKDLDMKKLKAQLQHQLRVNNGKAKESKLKKDSDGLKQVPVNGKSGDDPSSSSESDDAPNKQANPVIAVA
jgi:hypothetical protein